MYKYYWKIYFTVCLSILFKFIRKWRRNEETNIIFILIKDKNQFVDLEKNLIIKNNKTGNVRSIKDENNKLKIEDEEPNPILVNLNRVI